MTQRQIIQQIKKEIDGEIDPDKHLRLTHLLNSLEENTYARTGKAIAAFVQLTLTSIVIGGVGWIVLYFLIMVIGSISREVLGWTLNMIPDPFNFGMRGPDRDLAVLGQRLLTWLVGFILPIAISYSILTNFKPQEEATDGPSRDYPPNQDTEV
jgi:hypothetical protein